MLCIAGSCKIVYCSASLCAIAACLSPAFCCDTESACTDYIHLEDTRLNTPSTTAVAGRLLVMALLSFLAAVQGLLRHRSTELALYTHLYPGPSSH